jgi:hypothetical protein
MAIFSKADEHLPLLTQVYQLDIDNEQEILNFALLHFAAYGLDMQRQKEGNPDGYKIEMANIYDCAYHVKRVMLSWYQHSGLPVEETGYLNALWRKHPAAPAILSDATMLHEWMSHRTTDRFQNAAEACKESELKHLITYPEYIIPANQLAMMPTGDIPSQIMSALKDLITGLIAGSKTLQKCGVCESIFIENRREQAFCSRRCADTEGSRRRRKTKKMSVAV